jgi:hypothetical protein
MAFFARFFLAPALAIRTVMATIGAIALVLPLGLALLKAVGLPLLVVMAILGAPLILLLAVLGLPIIIVLAIALVALMALPLLFAVGAIALKIFLFVVLPVWLLVKAVKWVLKPRGGEAGPPAASPPGEPNTATGDL